MGCEGFFILPCGKSLIYALPDKMALLYPFYGIFFQGSAHGIITQFLFGMGIFFLIHAAEGVKVMRALTASQLDAILINFIFSGWWVFTFCCCYLHSFTFKEKLWLSAPLFSPAAPISTYIIWLRLEIPFALTDSAPYSVDFQAFFSIFYEFFFR